MQKVPLLDLRAQLKPLRARILKGWTRALDAGSFVNGPEMRAFEQEAAAFAGSKQAVACNSGTDALVLLLRAYGVGPGDEVLVPAFSFFATAEAVSLCGAKPVFCDIREEDFLLDVADLERRITRRTRAVIAVHLFGLPMDLRPLKRAVRGTRIRILEDTAQAFGARTPEGAAGASADGGALSFYPTKNLSACGDAGMALCADEGVAALLRQLREHGSSKRYVHERIGYNSRMDELQAVVLRVKLPYLQGWIERRRRVARAYLKGLKGLPLGLPQDHATCVWHQFTLRVKGSKRDALKAHLEELGIATAAFYPVPMHLQKPYLGRRSQRLPRAEAAAAEVLSLPMYPELKAPQIARIIQGVKAFYGMA